MHCFFLTSQCAWHPSNHTLRGRWYSRHRKAEQDPKKQKKYKCRKAAYKEWEGRCVYRNKCRGTLPSRFTNRYLSVSGCKKKPRMRTADDVISRIIWDSSVDPADFKVGHLDRFLGVLERPFSDFSWDTQVCYISTNMVHYHISYMVISLNTVLH